MLDPRELAKFIPEDPDGPIDSDLPQPTPRKKKPITEAPNLPQSMGIDPRQIEWQKKHGPAIAAAKKKKQKDAAHQRGINRATGVKSKEPAPEETLPEYRQVEKKIAENDLDFIAALAGELTDDPIVWEANTKKGPHLLNDKGNEYDEFEPDDAEFKDKSKNAPSKKDKPGEGKDAKVSPGEGGKGATKGGQGATAVPELKKAGKDALKKKGEPTKSREPGVPNTGSQKYKGKGGPSESASTGGVIGFKSPDILASVNGAPTDSDLQNLEEDWRDVPHDWDQPRPNFPRRSQFDPQMSRERMMERGLDPDSADIADAGALAAIHGSEHAPEDPGWVDPLESEPDPSLASGGLRIPSPERPDYEEYVDELPDAASRTIDTPEGPKTARFLRSSGPDPTREVPDIGEYDLDDVERRMGVRRDVSSPDLPPSRRDAMSLRRQDDIDFDELTRLDHKEKKDQKSLAENNLSPENQEWLKRHLSPEDLSLSSTGLRATEDALGDATPLDDEEDPLDPTSGDMSRRLQARDALRQQLDPSDFDVLENKEPK